MKSKKSLFQAATQKYTSLHTDLKEAKKVYLAELVAPANPKDAMDLNALYSGSKKDDKGAIQFSTIPASNPGGSESGNQTETLSGGAVGAENPNPAAPTGSPNAPGAATPNELAKGLQLVTINGQNYIIADDPNQYKYGKMSDFKELQAAQDKFNKSIKEDVTIYTTEDIMSALKTLSTGEVIGNTAALPEDDGLSTGVQPAGDVLAMEDEENEGDTLEATDESGTAQPEINTSSDISMPSGSSMGGTSASTGSAGSASSFMPTETEDTYGTQDNVTGVSSDYTTEDGKTNKGGEEAEEKAPEGNIGVSKTASKGAGDAEEKTGAALGPAHDPTWDAGKGDNAIAKGAGELNDTTGTVEAGCAEGEGQECAEGEGNPSGKESAFWLPNDDLLGLKDIVGTVAKKGGVPDAQETIGKDAVGNLVKKPTTPAHSVPNMKQYVRTNPMPGQPMRAPGSQPVDISDLDGVMGMDSANDRALNISLNFNF